MSLNGKCGPVERRQMYKRHFGGVAVVSLFIFLHKGIGMGAYDAFPRKLASERLSGLHQDFLNTSVGCHSIAARVPEPFTGDYLPNKGRIDVNGIQYARYEWDRPITRGLFERAVQTTLAVHLKVIDAKLFLRTHGPGFKGTMEAIVGRFVPLLEQLMLTLRLYDIPDTDVVITTADTVACDLPLMGYANTVECGGEVGFTLPSYKTWSNALGPTQLDVHFRCMDVRYPYDSRIPKAVWRGSLTGGVDGDNFFSKVRWHVGYVGDALNDIMDIGITGFTQHQQKSSSLEVLQDSLNLRDPISEEAFNKYAVVLDVDGNGWSSRFTRLLNYNTPILKQEMVIYKETLSDFLEEGTHIFTFKSNLTDLAHKTKELLNVYNTDRNRLKQVIRNAQQIASEHESQLGTLRATAFALTAYAKYLTWETKMEEGFVEVPQFIGGINKALPEQMYHQEGVLDARAMKPYQLAEMLHKAFGWGRRR